MVLGRRWRLWLARQLCALADRITASLERSRWTRRARRCAA